MHVYHQNTVIIIEQIIGAVAMVHIPVQDHHLQRRRNGLRPRGNMLMLKAASACVTAACSGDPLEA